MQCRRSGTGYTEGLLQMAVARLTCPLDLYVVYSCYIDRLNCTIRQLVATRDYRGLPQTVCDRRRRQVHLGIKMGSRAGFQLYPHMTSIFSRNRTFHGLPITGTRLSKEHNNNCLIAPSRISSLLAARNHRVLQLGNSWPPQAALLAH